MKHKIQQYLTTVMTFTTSEHKYVQFNDQNIPIIAGTTMKVVELVTAQRAYG